MSLRTLFGFLSPELLYSKESLPVEVFPLSSRAILLGDCNGGLSVKAGDTIKSGQALSPGLVSTVTGKVAGISDLMWLEGKNYKAIEIETARDEWDSSVSGEADPLKKSAEELKDKLKKAGFDINGLEKSDTVVINGVDSDILVSICGAIIRDGGETLKNGIAIVKHITGAGKAVLAATEINSSAAENAARGVAEVAIVKGVYPNGAPQILERTAGQGKTCVVSVEKLCAISECLSTGRPFIEKMVTLIDKGGRPVKNLKVRIGTPVGEIINSAGLELENNDKLILGGPMTGKTTFTGDYPVTCETDAIMAQGAGEVYCVEDSPCISCGKCISACPLNLQINLISRSSEFSQFEKCEELDIDYCIECGMCAYVCTSRRPLVQFVQFARNEIKKLKEKVKEQEKEEE